MFTIPSFPQPNRPNSTGNSTPKQVEKRDNDNLFGLEPQTTVNGKPRTMPYMSYENKQKSNFFMVGRELAITLYNGFAAVVNGVAGFFK